MNVIYTRHALQRGRELGFPAPWMLDRALRKSKRCSLPEHVVWHKFLGHTMRGLEDIRYFYSSRFDLFFTIAFKYKGGCVCLTVTRLPVARRSQLIFGT